MWPFNSPRSRVQKVKSLAWIQGGGKCRPGPERSVPASEPHGPVAVLVPSRGSSSCFGSVPSQGKPPRSSRGTGAPTPKICLELQMRA